MPSMAPSDHARPVESVPPPPMSMSPPNPLALPSRPFVFTATGTAYFRIWIVNLLLTIVTIGFYSPWAKVRRLRYFYGNTTFDGSPFEFHGRPIALLKGRIIGLVLLIAYTQAAKVSLMLWGGVVVVLVILMPWLLWKSLRFRLANSSYRGIRFGFDGTVRQAYLTFVPLMLMFLTPTLMALVSQETIGSRDPKDVWRYLGFVYLGFGIAMLFAPWFYFRLRAYQHRNARLGSTAFAFDGRLRSAYWLAFKLVLLGIGFALIACIPAIVVGIVAVVTKPATGRDPSIVLFVAIGALGYLILLSGLSQPLAMIQNFVWNHSTLAGVRFTSEVRRSRLWVIMLGNLVLTIVTLGLFWPFAVVRAMRYRIGAVAWNGDSGNLLVGHDDLKVGATGEETADLFGLDIAL